MRGDQRRRARAAALGARRADRAGARRSAPRGLVWAFVEEGGSWRSPIAKFLSEAELRRASNERLGRASRATCCWSSPTTPTVAARVLGALRLRAGRAASSSIPPGAHDLLWVVDFPMFEWNEDEQRWDRAAPPVHGAERRPRRPRRAALARLRPRARRLGDRRRLDPHPRPRGAAAGVRAARHRAPRRRRRASASCSTRCATARRRTAASRWASTASSRCSPAASHIRDVIAFPKTATGADPLTGAPAPVDPRQLRELGLRVPRDRPRS